MKVSSTCKAYFRGFSDVLNCKNRNTIKALGLLKIASYFTLIIPATFLIVYKLSSLYGRVKSRNINTATDQTIVRVSEKLKKLSSNNSPPSSRLYRKTC